jgi:hypothetical protein
VDIEQVPNLSQNELFHNNSSKNVVIFSCEIEKGKNFPTKINMLVFQFRRGLPFRERWGLFQKCISKHGGYQTFLPGDPLTCLKYLATIMKSYDTLNVKISCNFFFCFKFGDPFWTFCDPQNGRDTEFENRCANWMSWGAIDLCYLSIKFNKNITALTPDLNKYVYETVSLSLKAKQF